jgi:hypothetical protein
VCTLALEPLETNLRMIEELIAWPVAAMTQANTLERHPIVPPAFASKRHRAATNERREQRMRRLALHLRA